MSARDEALLFMCDEAACKEDGMFYELFSMDDRWDIIRAVLNAAKTFEDSLKGLNPPRPPADDLFTQSIG